MWRILLVWFGLVWFVVSGVNIQSGEEVAVKLVCWKAFTFSVPFKFCFRRLISSVVLWSSSH